MPETSQIWQRQKNESSKSFAYFKIYRDLGANRSLEKIIKKITTNVKKSEQIGEILPIPTKTQLGNLSSKWSWVNRTIAYDNYLDEKRLKEKEEAYIKIEPELINAGKDLLEIVKETIGDLKDNFDDSKAVSIANSLQSVAKAYDKSVSNIRLLHGQSTSINDNNTKIEGKIDSDVKLDSSQKLVMQPEFVELSKALLKKANHENNTG